MFSGSQRRNTPLLVSGAWRKLEASQFEGDPALTSFFQGGQARYDGVDTGVDSVFDFPQYFALRKAFGEGQSMKDFATMLAHDYLYPDPNNLVTLLGLHDVKRFMNEPKATIESHSTVEKAKQVTAKP